MMMKEHRSRKTSWYKTVPALWALRQEDSFKSQATLDTQWKPDKEGSYTGL